MPHFVRGSNMFSTVQFHFKIDVERKPVKPILQNVRLFHSISCRLNQLKERVAPCQTSCGSLQGSPKQDRRAGQRKAIANSDQRNKYQAYLTLILERKLLWIRYQEDDCSSLLRGFCIINFFSLIFVCFGLSIKC